MVQQMRQHTCPYSQKRPGSLQAVRALLVEPEKIRDKQTEAIHGDFIDDLWAERTDYGDEVDNILSAIVYAQQFIEEHIYGSREHTVYLDSGDGDGGRAEIYVLEDEDMD